MSTRLRTLVVIAVLLWPTRGLAQVSVTAPSGGANAVASANDFATLAFQDPWDMSERTDLGWFLHGSDQPLSGFSAFNFSGGLFSGTIGSNDTNLFLLETGLVGAAPVGKMGTNYPIDANAYIRLALRMRSPSSSLMQFFWSTNTIYDPPGFQASNTVNTTAGWRYYFVDLAALGLQSGTEAWNGFKRSLRIDPTTAASGTLDIDWVRLTDFNPALVRTITWNGNAGNNVDIYLTASTTPTSDPTQLLGLVASNVGGSSFQLYVGALAPGDYYVAMRRSNQTGNNFSFSTGFFRVNAIPRVTVTAPSEEGSTDDFATTFLGNPWDMNTLGDVDHLANVNSPAVVTLNNVVAESGAALGNLNVFSGINAPGVVSPDPCASASDPVVFAMNPMFRGFSNRIDPARYRILTAELGVPNRARGICDGAVARIVWRVAGQANETVSEDIVLNSRANATVMNKLIVDMATMPIDPASPNQIGWVAGGSANPGLESFRIDPHEYVNATPFFIRRMKLASLETAHTNYTVQWTSSESSGTVNIYYDVDRDPMVKQFIGSVAATATSGSFGWNTSGLPDGDYFVFVEFNDGSNFNGAYSRWPIRVDHTPPPIARLVPNRPLLNFGVTNLTQKTPPQTLRLTAVDAPAGQPCWNITSDVFFVLVNPPSGCGSGAVTVSLMDTQYGVTGVGFSTLTLTSPGAMNSPQHLRAYFRITSTSTRPFGAVDTPGQGASVSGSVAFTGWALDDIGVTRVTICRLAVGGETPAADGRCGGASEVYLGDAVMIEDARPDVEAVAPDTPFNYRGGWGFLVLTNMLPNQGNGQFVFNMRAFEVEGGFTLLGSRTINVNNASATAPFGAIDTPGQGEVISGTSYFNFGWALTAQPKTIPTNGSTITVFVDGVPIGNPTYNQFRGDVAGLFPGLNNTNGAGGALAINTTAYANGVHTIAWSVTDNQGASAGIGSRFFTVFNTGGSPAPEAMAGHDLGRAVSTLDAIPARLADVRVRRGFDPGASLRPVAAGLRSVGVWHQMFDRVEVHLERATLAHGTYEGYLVKADRLAPLPVGSSLDRHRGVFAWQPGVGYFGSYEFVFVRTSTDGTRERIPVRVVLEPQAATRVATVTPLPRAFRGLLFPIN